MPLLIRIQSSEVHMVRKVWITSCKQSHARDSSDSSYIPVPAHFVMLQLPVSCYFITILLNTAPESGQVKVSHASVCLSVRLSVSGLSVYFSG